ncbi:Hypothetical protein A7982_01586 [Minicystis rosea]|nr:Hypothetical protein A7982_01586 [Minicystis rosea]
MIKMALYLCLGPACAPIPDVDSAGSSAQDSTATRAPSTASWAPPPDVIAWTLDGAPALVDGASGAVLQPLPAMEGTGDRDVAWDPWSHRVVILQGDEGGEGGEIASHTLTSTAAGRHLGDRVHVAWIDGRARVLPAPAGVVVMEESYGSRHRLLGATPTASVAAPPPASAWLTIEPAGAVLHTLAAREEPPALEVRASLVSEAGVALPEVQSLAIGPASTPSTARLVPGPSEGSAILVDVAGSSLVVRLIDGGSAGPASTMALPAPDMRIEAAVSLRGGSVVAMLMSGVTRIIAISLDPSGAVSGAAHLSLPGEITPPRQLFSRNLAAQGPDRVLAATSAGLHSVRVTQDGNGVLGLELASAFVGSALRGPIAVVEPSPE